MPEIVGKIPEFTTDETNGPAPVELETEEVKETPVETEVTETDTPAEPPAAPEPTPDLERAIQGLQNERVKLLREISELKGHRRELKQEELIKVDERIDDLKDVNPEDVNLIEKVLRAKGLMTKDETSRMFYEAVKNEELNKFLDQYPEYKPENDPDNVNWSTLEREVALYRRPNDPHQIRDILLRAHRGIVRAPSDRSLPAKKRQIELASVGAGGVSRSSSRKSLDPSKRALLEQGGWSEEEIKRIESNLPE